MWALLMLLRTYQISFTLNRIEQQLDWIGISSLQHAPCQTCQKTQKQISSWMWGKGTHLELWRCHLCKKVHEHRLACPHPAIDVEPLWDFGLLTLPSQELLPPAGGS